ncbi:(+)-neomenthol dehydrogenase-like isoform X1 [Macadamia integrifolia]|uniref:(+)-neomenthol dehydrogenase-like isoform X1 n=1 Tax=Macadamia integrifolia TaxID=60698 RepID=UPI001C52F2FF|nr:(+)-neomenthol dehydrogenase-like isoform X1 [Macadamia integrifolia]
MEGIKNTRYAVVTGANKGIGFEITKQLACEGVTVILTARDEKRGMEAAASLVNSGLPHVVFHRLDVRDPASTVALAEFVLIQFGRLDILVNNAGATGIIMDVGGLKALNIDPTTWLSGKAAKLVEGVSQQTSEKAEECLDTNYYGCKRVTESLIPLLKLSRSGGRIVNVSSLRGEFRRIPNEQIRNELGNIDTLTEEKLDGILQRFIQDFKQNAIEANGWSIMLPAYSISKATINGYTRILAQRYPEMCINCVHPGYVNTDLNWHTGTMTLEEGAKGPVMLALLPNGGPSGCYFDQTEMSDF